MGYGEGRLCGGEISLVLLEEVSCTCGFGRVVGFGGLQIAHEARVHHLMHYMAKILQKRWLFCLDVVQWLWLGEGG